MLLRCRMLAGLALAASFLVATNTPAADLDPMVPGDAEAVIKLNFKQVLDSALVKKYALDIIKQALQSPDAQQILTATGLDPFKDFDSITLSAAGTTHPRVLIVVRGRFNVAKINAALDAKAQMEPNSFKKTQVGKLVIWEGKKEDQNQLYSAVVNQNTAVMSTDKAYLVKSVGDEGKNQPSRELRAAVAKVPGKESLWMAGIITDDIKKKMQDRPETKKYAASIESLTGGITLTDAFQFTGQIHTNNPMIAAELKKVLEGVTPIIQLMAQGNEQFGPLFKEVLAGLKITTMNTTVSVDLKVSEELIKKFAQKQ